MHPEEFFTWWLPPEQLGGRWHLSRWKMTREQARAHPGAERDDGSKEIRWIPDSPDEYGNVGAPRGRKRPNG